MSQQINIRTLEGVAKRFELALRTASGAPLPAAEWQLGGGAENSSGEKVDATVVEFADGRAVLQLPPLTPGPQKVCKPRREPWGYQLRATELATGRVYVLLQGELTVDPWYGETEPGEGMVDASRVAADAALADAEVVTGTITIGIAGPRGEQGPQGEKGEPFTYADLTEEQKAELVAPLAYEEAPVSPAGTPDNNANVYGFAYTLSRAGLITALEVRCRINGTATPTDAPLWVKVWRGTTLLGVSHNSQLHAVGAVLRYEFAEPFAVAAGDELRVSFHTEDGLSTTAYQMGVESCVRSVTLQEGESGGALNSSGGWGSQSYTAAHTWHMQVERYAPAAHVEDTTAHLTEEEHAGLTALLAKKDALLALLNS